MLYMHWDTRNRPTFLSHDFYNRIHRFYKKYYILYHLFEHDLEFVYSLFIGDNVLTPMLSAKYLLFPSTLTFESKFQRNPPQYFRSKSKIHSLLYDLRQGKRIKISPQMLDQIAEETVGTDIFPMFLYYLHRKNELAEYTNIFTPQKDFLYSDNAQVTAKGGDVRAVNSRESSGISASRPLIIDGSAILKAYGGDVTKNTGASNEWSTSMGICAADFKASANASVYAYGGRTYGDLAGSSMGVYIHKFVSEHSEAKLSENAFLYAEGGQSGGSSYGIYGDRYANQQSLLTIEDNAYIEAVGKEIEGVHGTDRSNGISTYGMRINGGTVIASAKTQANQDKIAAILLNQPPLPTYAQGLTPIVTAGVSEETAGPVDAALAGTYANRWVKIQTRESNYAITAAPSVIDFGTVKTDYAQPAPKTVTITNTGNETVDLSGEVLQENSNYTVSKLSESRIAPRRTAEITVQPKDDLAAGEYNETLTISGSNKVSASVQLKFNVIKSSGSGSGGGGGGFLPPVPITPTEPTTSTEPENPNNSANRNIKIIKGVKNTTITLKSKLTKKNKILLTWKKAKGYKVDRFEIYRSVKKNSGYGKKAFFATKNGEVSTYLNTKNLRTGKTYYYKLRGVRIIDGQKYYTQWSNKAWRTVLH